MPRKRELFARDSDFRLAFDTLELEWGADQTLAFARDHAITFLKPDAFALGCASSYLKILDQLGFDVVFHSRRNLDEATMRAVWRHQWNIASLDRLFTLSRLNLFSDIIVMLARQRTPGSLPASVALAARKGSANPLRRAQGDIRSKLDCPNVFFSAVHVSDEPADVIRELGILYGAAELATLAATSPMRPCPAQAAITCERLERETGAHCFKPEISARRLLALLPVDFARQDVVRSLNEIASGRAAVPVLQWRYAVHWLTRVGVVLPRWDELVVASQLVVPDIEGKRQILGGADLALWQDPGS